MKTWGARSNLYGILFCLVLFFNLNPVSAQENLGSRGDISLFQYTGAAVSSVPILVPPGRNGIAPKLALTYNSYRRNTWIGVGWDMDVGAIQRSTKRGVCYECDDYVASMNGSSSELVPRPDWGPDYYGAKIEGAFTRYRYNGSNGWEVTTKDGMTYFYGQDPESRQDDPRNSARVFKWCLDKVKDSNGNYMVIEYEKEPDGPGSYNGQIYLDRIDYTGNSGLDPSNYVRFHLENRDDAPSMYHPHFEVKTAKKLKTIEVESIEGLVRIYHLNYDDSPASFRSLLRSVQQYGSDGLLDSNYNVSSGTALPDITFNYQAGADNFKNGVQWVPGFGNEAGGWRVERHPRFMSDVNGDGMADVVGFASHGVVVSLSTGSGFTSPSTWVAGYGNGSGSWSVERHPRFMSDVNGDGMADVVGFASHGVVVSLSTGSGFTSPSTWVLGYGNESGGWSVGRHPRFMTDVNGDGMADVVGFASNGVVVSLSTGSGFTSRSLWVYGYGTDGGWKVDRHPRFMTDVNGDGMADVVGFASHGVVVSLSTGSGFTPPATWVAGYGNESGSWRVERHPRFMTDVNGDGMADVVGFASHGVVVSLSTGSGFTSPATWVAGYGNESGSWRVERHPRFMSDVNGDGMADVVGFASHGVVVSLSTGSGFTSPATWVAGYGNESGSWSVERHPRFMADVNGDGMSDVVGFASNGVVVSPVESGINLTRPDLLIETINGIGASTTIAYKPSSKFDNHLLPFTVHVVSRVSINDGFNNHSTTTYDYSGGFFDYKTREFRGFAAVTQANPNGTDQTTSFYQGREDSEDLPEDIYYFKGRAARVEFNDSNGSTFVSTLLSKTDFTLGTYPVIPEDWGFVKLEQKQSISYDGVIKTTEEDYVFDNENGNLIGVTTSGTGAESISKTFDYQNYGSEEDPIWRKTFEKVEGESGVPERQAWYDYDNSGNPIEEEHWNNNPDDPTNLVIKMKYDAYGNQTESWDAKSSHLYPNNPTITIQYDPETHTSPVRITNSLRHTVEYEYNNPFSKVSAERDSNGNWTYYHYDPIGRIELTELPNGGETTVDWEDHVFPRYVRISVKEDDSGSTIDAYEYFDGLGRGLQTISFGENEKPIVAKTRYDDMGRVDQTWGPFFSTFIGYHAEADIPENVPYVKTEYDLRSRPIRIETPLGEDVDSATIAETTFSYSGLSTTVEDPDGGKKTEKKDYLGRILQVTEYSNTGEIYTSYQYNAAGDLLSVTDAMGNETSMTYDSLGRKTRMSDPDMDPYPDSEEGDWTYTYDLNGNLITQTDAKGVTITFVYDKLNRMTDQTYSTPPAIDPPVKYTYDEASVQYGIGRLYKVENANASTTIDAYDETGQELSVTRHITGASLSAYTTIYSYDYSGKVKSMMYPGTTPYQVNYEYHPGSGLLYTVTGITDFTEYAELSGYEPTGKIGEIYYGNGAQTLYTYDNQSTRLLSINSTDPNLADLQDRAYKYTLAGDIKSITRISEAHSVTHNYAYDKLHRLIAETNTGGSDDFDPSMLIKTFDDTAPIHAVKSVNFNRSNYPYEYDNNGNMIQNWDFSDPLQPVRRVIDYNADNMPVKIVHERSSGTVTVDLSYDGEGARIKKAVAGSTIYYIGDHFEVAAGAEIKYIFAGNLRIAKVTAEEKLFYHKDHLGSTIFITDYSDGSGAETAEYLPFGLYRTHSETEVTYYKFNDQELDAEVGLYNYNARLYDPAIGIFISPDSVVPDPFDPQTLNRYTYCRNNPLIYTDPNGHFFGIATVIIGAVVGAVNAGIQSDWDPGAMAAGAVIGGVSAGVGSGVSGIAGELIGSHVAGAVAGTVASAGVSNQLNSVMASNGGSGNQNGDPYAQYGTISASPSGFRGIFDSLYTDLYRFANPDEFGPNSRIGVAGKYAYFAIELILGGRGGGQGIGRLFRNYAPRRVTSRLQQHVNRAVREIDMLADAAFTPKQLRAILRNKNLRPPFRGNRIDVRARQFIKNDPKLQHLQSNYSKGPDFVNKTNRAWWDMTTPKQWPAHVKRYGPGGKLLRTQ